MNIGPCGCCGRIMDLGPGVCHECPEPATDGGGLSMCAYHEMLDGEPSPDCDDCLGDGN